MKLIRKTESYALLFLAIVFLFMSCNKDDVVEIDNSFPPDYIVLKELYDANSGNTLGWNFDDTSMKSWGGVT
ncbi:MAG TPA: hypothetical protein ENK46_08385, partial [Flavobacteriia bacterium]|nr:hypothetical protein [Flavobacteriia bacterium]